MKKTSVMGVEDEDESEDQEKAPLIRHERESDTENDLVQGVEACVKSKWPPRKSSDRTVFLAVFIAALGPLGFGFATGYSSPALEDLLQDGSKPRLTRDEGAWFSSLLHIGAVVGSAIGGWTVEIMGRKGSIMACAVPFEVGFLLTAYGASTAILCLGRFVTGVGVGMVALAVPIYIAEISTANLRGALGSANQLSISFGVLFVYVIGVYLKWQWLAVFGAVIPALLAVLMVFIPETPRWLVTHSKMEKAEKSLKWLRGGGAHISEELCEIEQGQETSHEKLSWNDLKKRSVYMPLVIGVGLLMFQQFNGAVAVIFNCASIFSTAGFKDGKAVSIMVAGVQFGANILTCLVVDKFGRRILLLVSSVIMCISQCGLGFYFELYLPLDSSGHPVNASSLPGVFPSIAHTIPSDQLSWLAITSLLLFNICFGLAWGPMPWLLMSEIFPLRIRGTASGAATLMAFACAFLVTRTFAPLQDTLTPQGSYWFYGGFCLLAFVFVYLVVPETKGRTLEEIEDYFEKKQYNFV